MLSSRMSDIISRFSALFLPRRARARGYLLKSSRKLKSVINGREREEKNRENVCFSQYLKGSNKMFERIEIFIKKRRIILCLDIQLAFLTLFQFLFDFYISFCACHRFYSISSTSLTSANSVFLYNFSNFVYARVKCYSIFILHIINFSRLRNSSISPISFSLCQCVFRFPTVFQSLGFVNFVTPFLMS